MPYAWVDPDVVLEHSEVTIFYAYKEDDYNQRLSYWYTVDVGEQSTFDIRDLPEYDPDLPHEDILCRAIDNKSPILMAELAKLEDE